MKKENKDFYIEMGLNIAYYRKKKGLTQEQLAEMIDADQTHISKIEIASVGISIDMLIAIAKALEVQPYQLIKFRD